VNWFQRSIDLLQSLPSASDTRLRSFFSADRPVCIARAPGRLDVMGGMADYSGARVRRESSRRPGPEPGVLEI
jgi:hypothetical protein